MGRVVYEVRNQVGYITLDNESKRNAVDLEMCKALNEIYAEIESNPEVRVAVITGKGDVAFSSGGYMREYLEEGDLGESGSGITRSIPKPSRLSKIAIAAINGFCIAGGFGLALTCDLRLASPNAVMGPSGIKRGAVPGAEQSQKLSRLVPVGIAMEMLLFSRWISASDAERIGLVNKVVEQDKLMETATEWAEYIAEANPVAVDNTKRAVYGGLDLPYAEAVALESQLFEESTKTDGAREGFSSFVEGRSR